MRNCLRAIFELPVTIDCAISKSLYSLTVKKKDNLNRTAVNPVFSVQQYVAHGEYDLPYPNNSLQLFQAVIKLGFKIIECDVMFTKDNIPILCHDQRVTKLVKTDDGQKADLKICNTPYSEIKNLNFSIDGNSHTSVTTLEELLVFAKDNGICIEIDLNKKYLGRKKSKLLFDLVQKENMLSSVIWEVYPKDLFSFMLLDHHLIYQLDNTWNKKAIKKYKRYQKHSSLIILSQWFPDKVEGDYEEIVKEGHRNGYLMKCATLNRQEETQKLFCQSVDFITTDSLTNDKIII